MLKIEIIKFEAQDVITTSVPNAPAAPVKPLDPTCKCFTANCIHDPNLNKEYGVVDCTCKATDHTFFK